MQSLIYMKYMTKCNYIPYILPYMKSGKNLDIVNYIYNILTIYYPFIYYVLLDNNRQCHTCIVRMIQSLN